MTTQTENITEGSIPMQTENQHQITFGTTQGNLQNIATTGMTQVTNNPSGGLIMSVGGGAGDEARDVTFSTKNIDGTAFGTLVLLKQPQIQQQQITE